MRSKFCFTILALLLQVNVWCGLVHGQPHADSLAVVKGKVMHAREGVKGTVPLCGATVLLVNDLGGEKDTLYTVTNAGGEFAFVRVRPKPSFLSVSCVGFKTEGGEYDIAEGANLCYFTLYEKTEHLGPATVTAEVPLSKRIGDTTIFNAAAVQMMDGENLRDLLGKLPGFEISADKIKVDGEEIKRTYVNGVLLFGDNAITAANALRSSEVSQVKVFDELTPEDKVRGLGNARKQRVLDIITKEAMISFSEAVLSASGGADDTGQPRYTGIASAAFYSELMSFEAMGVLDNTSQGLGFGMGSSPSSALMGLGNQTGQLSAYREDAVAGADFEKYWGSRDFGSNIKAHYKYGHSYGRDETIRHENHFLSDGSDGLESNDTLGSSSHSGKHNLDLEFTLRKTPTRSLYGHIGGAFDADFSKSRDAGMEMYGTDAKTRDESMLSNREGYHLFGAFYFKDISRQNLKISSDLNVQYTETKTPLERLDTLDSSSVRMRITSDGTGTEAKAALSTSAEWVPVNSASRTWRIGGSISCSWDRETCRQESSDIISGLPVTSLSETCDYTMDLTQPEIALTTQYTSHSIDMSAGLKASAPVMNMHERFPSMMDEKKAYPGIVPSFNLKWKDLKINLEGRQILPSVSQIRRRVSDRNTFSLIAGNPNIRPAYSIETGIDWSRTLGLLSMSASVNQSFCRNAILSKTYFINEDTVLTDWDGYSAKAGSILYTYDNAMAPASSTSATLRLSRLMAKRKLIAGITLRGGINNSPMYFGEEYVKLNETQMSTSLSIQWTPDRHWKAALSPEVMYRNSGGGDYPDLSKCLSSALRASVNARFGAFLGNMSYALTDIDYLSGCGVSLTRHILNASLGYSFFKKTLVVKAEGFDLLNAGSVYTMNLTPEVMTQTWKPTYGRRFMLTATYHFRKSK